MGVCLNDAVQNRTGNRRRCVHSELKSHVGVGSGSPEKAGVTCTNRKCKEEILLWDAIEQKFASDEFKNRVRALREASLISIDNESRELILEGHARTITGQAGQIYRAYTNSDHGIDGLAAPGQSPTWVQFTPYVWATSVKGNMTVNGVTAPMDINLSDLWQLVKNGEVRGGFMGHLAFGRDNWTMFVNGDIVSMDPSAEVRRASIETGLTMTLLELGGAVNLYNADESEPFNSPLRIQMLGGIRYYAVETSAILSLPNISAGDNRSERELGRSVRRQPGAGQNLFQYRRICAWRCGRIWNRYLVDSCLELCLRDFDEWDLRFQPVSGISRV